MTSSRRIWLLTAILVVALALGIVLGRFVLAPAAPPAGQFEPVALETAAPTATATPTAPAPSATPTRLTATKTIHSTPTPTALPAAPVARTPGPTVAPDLALEFSKLKPNSTWASWLNATASHWTSW